MPLLHPARTLPAGDVRAAGGLSGQIAIGSIAEDLRSAKALAASNADLPGTPGSNPAYAKGALVAAAVAPGLAPFVAGRVGIGGNAEGGITYTGRAARLDMRRSFETGSVQLSIGAGVTVPFYGRQQGSPLPNVDLSALHGYGADIPFLVGWTSKASLYSLWIGARAGAEHVGIDNLTSEPKSVTIGTGSISLAADRFYGGGLLGLAVGFRHVHVALELDVSYQTVNGRYNDTPVSVKGVSLTPASAVWWDF